MPSSDQTEIRNSILARVPASEMVTLRAQLERVTMLSGAILQAAGEPAKSIYFVESGILSLLAPLKHGGRIEIGHIGREGAAGVHAALGAERLTSEIMAQSDSVALRVDALLLPFATLSSATCTGYTSQRRGQEYILTFTFSNAPEIAVTQTATFDIRTSSGSASATLYGLEAGVGDSRQWLHTGSGALVTLVSAKADASIEYLVCGWVRSPAASASSSSRLTQLGVSAARSRGGAVAFTAGAIGEPEIR